MEGWFRKVLLKRRTGIVSEIWDFQWTVTLGCQFFLTQFRNRAVFTSLSCRCLPPSRTRKHQGQQPWHCTGHPTSLSSPRPLWTPQTEIRLQIPCWPFSHWTTCNKGHLGNLTFYSSLSLDVTQTQNNESHHMKASHRPLKLIMFLQTPSNYHEFTSVFIF